MKWMPVLAVAGLALVLGVAPVLAQQGPSGTAGQTNAATAAGRLNSKDYGFLVQAARINMEEVRAGEIAQKNGVIRAVRDFGEYMINDHSKLNTGLQEIAEQKGAAMPAQLSQKQSSALHHLEGLSGASFDQAYAQAMVQGHTHAVKKFQWAAKNLSDQDLRAWAQTALPLLQEHLRMAKNMEAAVRKAK